MEFKFFSDFRYPRIAPEGRCFYESTPVVIPWGRHGLCFRTYCRRCGMPVREIATFSGIWGHGDSTGGEWSSGD